MDLSYRVIRTYQNGKTEKCYGEMYIHSKDINKSVKDEMRRQLINQEKMSDPSIDTIDIKWI